MSRSKSVGRGIVCACVILLIGFLVWYRSPSEFGSFGSEENSPEKMSRDERDIEIASLRQRMNLRRVRELEVSNSLMETMREIRREAGPINRQPEGLREIAEEVADDPVEFFRVHEKELSLMGYEEGSLTVQWKRFRELAFQLAELKKQRKMELE